MDVAKLIPAPWFSYGEQVCRGTPFDGSFIAEFEKRDDAFFVALARNAFDVMMRREWYPRKLTDGTWRVSCASVLPTRLINMHWDCPFAALVEADKWYRENVEK